MTQKQKTNFRRSKKWLDFRRRLIEGTDFSCELCGTKYYGKAKRKLQVHHHDPDEYTNLDDRKFSVLCVDDHKLVERMARKVLAKSPRIRNVSLWYELLKDHLPDDARAAMKKLSEGENGVT